MHGLRRGRKRRFPLHGASGRQPGAQHRIYPFLDVSFDPCEQKPLGIWVRRRCDADPCVVLGATYPCRRLNIDLGPKCIEGNTALTGFEFERLQARPFDHLHRIRDCRTETTALLSPFEIIDALGVNLNATADAHPVAQSAIGLWNHGAEPPAFAGSDLLEHIDLCSSRGTVHRARHGWDCPSFSKLAQTSAAKWTPQWTPNLRFCGHHGGHHGGNSLILIYLVPKKGLEPPHPCEYVDLTHARLPIPPLRHDTQIQRLPPDRQHL